MTRNLTAEDKRSAFVRATCSMSGAADRWKSRAATGLTDEQLHDALKFELGIFGGSTSHGNCPDLMFQGNGLKIWASWGSVNHVTTRPTFQGQQTMAMAREIYGIRRPDDKQLSLL